MAKKKAAAKKSKQETGPFSPAELAVLSVLEATHAVDGITVDVADSLVTLLKSKGADVIEALQQRGLIYPVGTGAYLLVRDDVGAPLFRKELPADASGPTIAAATPSVPQPQPEQDLPWSGEPMQQQQPSTMPQMQQQQMPQMQQQQMQMPQGIPPPNPGVPDPNAFAGGAPPPPPQQQMAAQQATADIATACRLLAAVLAVLERIEAKGGAVFVPDQGAAFGGAAAPPPPQAPQAPQTAFGGQQMQGNPFGQQQGFGQQMPPQMQGSPFGQQMPPQNPFGGQMPPQGNPFGGQQPQNGPFGQTPQSNPFAPGPPPGAPGFGGPQNPQNPFGGQMPPQGNPFGGFAGPQGGGGFG